MVCFPILRILVESTFALPSPGLSLHFEESFPTERAVRLACPGRGVSEVSDGWNLDGACTKRQGVSPQAVKYQCVEMLPFRRCQFFFGINKILKSHEEPWLKQMLFREVTECGTDIAQLIHHASSQTILFKNNIFQSGKFNSLRKKNTSWHHMSSVEPVEPVELTEISLKMAPRSATPKAEKPDRAEAARQRWAEASSLG